MLIKGQSLPSDIFLPVVTRMRVILCKIGKLFNKLFVGLEVLVIMLLREK